MRVRASVEVVEGPEVEGPEMVEGPEVVVVEVPEVPEVPEVWRLRKRARRVEGAQWRGCGIVNTEMKDEDKRYGRHSGGTYFTSWKCYDPPSFLGNGHA